MHSLRTTSEIPSLRGRLAAVRLDVALFRLHRALQKYDPGQPRVPAGQPTGGQWTGGGGSAELSASRRRIGGGRYPSASPGQQARLAASQIQAERAIHRVREVDPRWRPSPSAYETIEGEIAANEAIVREAEGRFGELGRVGVGPGPFAVESIPARGPERNFTRSERAEINRIGYTYGCHTCGTREPGTRSGNFVCDHQIPTSLNLPKLQQNLYPHCLICSLRQGGYSSGRRTGK